MSRHNSTSDWECENDFKCLKAVEVVKLMENELIRVSEVVQKPKNLLRLLMSKCKWDAETFLERFYEGQHETEITLSEEVSVEKNTEKMEVQPVPPLKETNQIMTRSKRKAASTSKDEPSVKVQRTSITKSRKVSLVDCGICFEGYKTEDVIALSCKHIFCRACFTTYLNTTIENHSLMDCIKCAGCQGLLSDETVMKFLDKVMQSKYHQLISRSFVQNSRMIRWCISPKCSRAIKVGVVKQPAVMCQCGTRFCFQCSQTIHDLIPCKLMKEFSDLKEANLNTAEFLVKNTKPCPSCYSEIEKNGGCNHMTCRNCGFEFCWLCFGNFRTHRTCTTPESVSFRTNHLRRLVDCSNKNSTMIQSINLDEKMYKSKLKKQDLETKDGWFKIDFVKNAVKILLRCRLSLADSYIFNYFFYNTENTQWARFDMNQSALLKSTEGLSLLLETQVTSDNLHEMKPKIETATQYCKNLHRAFFVHVKEGFENDLWKRN